MIRGLMNARSFPAVSVVSLGKSIHQSTFMCSLRMINSLESSQLNQNALSPSWIEVSSGKSIHHSLSGWFTLKCDTKTLTECTLPKYKRFQTGHVYSSLHSFTTTLQFQWSIMEIETHFMQISHFNHFQRRHIVNLTHGILIEGITTHLQWVPVQPQV